MGKNKVAAFALVVAVFGGVVYFSSGKKPPEVVVRTVIVAVPVETPAAAPPAEEPKPAPAPVKKAKKASKFDAAAEEAAYKKASFNAQRADCLRRAVDRKACYDIARGEISDWGPVLVKGVCD